MKTSSILVALVSAIALFASLTSVWQARSIRELAKEQAALHTVTAAGQTTGSLVLGSFGPNMGLAKDLLEHGEQEAVLKYFELCRKFWSNNEKLNQWKADVEAGRIPEFGGNLFY